LWTFWLCRLISPKRNEFLQRIFLTKLLPTVCNTPTKFQTDSSKNEKKVWVSYFWNTGNPPIDSHSCTFFWDFHNCKKSRTHPTFLFFFLQQRPWKKIMWTNFEFLWNIGGVGAKGAEPMVFYGLFWLCGWISLKVNEFLQVIFLSDVLPTVCYMHTEFQRDSSKIKEKVWRSYVGCNLW